MKAAYTNGRANARRVRVVACPAPQPPEVRRGALATEREAVAGAAVSQPKGGPMTPGSMARFLKALYGEGGLSPARRRTAAGAR